MKRGRYALVALIACSDATTNPVQQLNLDRPVDVAFACYGGYRFTEGPRSGEEALSAQPIASCNVRSGPRVSGQDPPVPPGQEETGIANWYAFVLQSGPGTVAIARFDTKPSASFGGADVLMLDADPLTPGKNGISVGEDPIAIATDKVGCYEIIANAGSCDLSTLDINSAVGATLGEAAEPLVKRMEVKNAAGEPIKARPAAMVFEPPAGTIGAECAATPQGLAYIAYPGCHLVAGVDVSTGTVVTSIQYGSGAPVIGDGNIQCPSECGGAAPTPGTRPVALDLEQDPRTGLAKLAIAADNSDVVHVFELDTQSFRPLSLLTPVVLENSTGRLGITSVSISPQIGMGGAMSVINDELSALQHQFVYAVATDGSIRVIDIAGSPRECDAQIDPRYLRDVRDVELLSCLPTPANAPTNACTSDTQCTAGICGTAGTCTAFPRRTGARGPGIELIGDAIPTSVDIVRVEPVPNDARIPGTPARLIGYFGAITAANGQVFLFNVDNDDYDDFVDPQSPLATPIPLVIPHQLRDNVPGRGLLAEEEGKFVCDDPGPDPDSQGGNQGGPRLGGSLARTLPPGVIAPEQVGGLPSVRQVLCDIDGNGVANGDDRPVNELFFSAPISVREEVFPDMRGMRGDETWSMTWEGSLSADKVDQAIDGPAVRMSQMLVDSAGMRIVDETRPFCDAGVEPWDVVQLRGCDPSIGDAGCPIGYTCYLHAQSQVTGIGACMLIDEAERLANACEDFLTSLRRYTVRTTKSGELQLVPRKHVLRTTPLDGCTDDAQCETLADYAVRVGSSVNPGDDNPPTDSKTWRCQADPDRKPVGGTGMRCINTCNADNDCAFGTICSAHPGAAPQMGYCMEGVVPPQSCVNAPQRYELRAGEAFTVLGTRQGYIHPIIADAGGNCVKDVNASPYQVGRIPLDAPACDPLADPRTGRKPDRTFEPNPCKTTVKETEYQLNYVGETCMLADPDESIVTRDATAIRLRNRAMQLTVVDPTYNGDLRCHGDRKGTLVNIPVVTPGYQLGFRLTAGFTPLTIAGIAPAFPIKVLRGPTESWWVIDQGDFLSTSITQPSTRGKVFRIESRAINIINLLE